MKGVSLLCMALLAAPVVAQMPTPNVPPDPNPIVSASLRASTTTPLLGQALTLTLVVRHPPSTTLTSWPTFGVEMLPFEVVDVEQRTISPRADEIVISQVLHGFLWATGSYTTPEIRLTYERDGRDFFVPVQSVTLTVAPRITDPLTAQRRADLPLLDLLSHGVLLAGLLAVMLAIVSVWWLRRRTWRAPAVARGRLALQIIAQLEDVRHSGLPADEVILLCVERLRAYLAHEMRINAPEMTTSELTSHLKEQRLLPHRLIAGLNTLLEQADLIKFANLSPSIDAAQFARASIRWVQQADQLMVGLYD